MKKLLTTTTLLLIFGIGHIQVAANDWEDKNSPISFQVEMLNWEEVDEILPRKKKFTIIDVETGLHFKVQRRAGNQHADVQPLTREDTKIMKEIYNGKWSWKRRAIIVLTDDQMIAASMHGMPHGAGALKNGFPGHFCVHFSGSSTHKSKKEDLSHKVMILKAAGKIDDYLNRINPKEMVDVLGVAIHNGDIPLLSQIVKGSCSNCEDKIKVISSFKISQQELDILDDYLMVEIPVRVDMYKEGTGKEKREISFILTRDHLVGRWLVDSKSLYEAVK